VFAVTERHGQQQPTARPEDSCSLAEQPIRFRKVFENLGAQNAVRGVVVEWSAIHVRDYVQALEGFLFIAPIHGEVAGLGEQTAVVPGPRAQIKYKRIGRESCSETRNFAIQEMPVEVFVLGEQL
jgi:hypothetical protein